jgi:hypothetical protein
MTPLSKGEHDERIKQLWRAGYSYREIIQRLPVDVTVDQLRHRTDLMGLYENRNASDEQIARVARKRLQDKATARLAWEKRGRRRVAFRDT